MADQQKVYTPEVIQDAPFPQANESNLGTTQAGSGGVYSPTTIKEQPLPTKKIATELLSTVINTKSKKILQEIQFTKSGALQIGQYENGVSGDLRISPNGILGRNISGITTFAIDGDTGDAVFSGTLQSRSLISGDVAVGDGDILIDGANKRMIFYENDIPIIVIGNV